MNIQGKKLLVTGGAGFIGSHLVEELLKEDVQEVLIYDNFLRGKMSNIENSLKDKRVKLFSYDLTNYDSIVEATTNMDGVFHLASVCLTHCQEDPQLGYNGNILGTFNLLNACIKNKVQRIVFSSSSSIYGDAEYYPIDEKHPFNTKNIYGATKICGEALFKSFYYKYNLPYLNLRYMNVYGPRQDYLGKYVAIIMILVKKLKNGEPPIIYGDGTQSYDFIYVKDVCKANIIAMESDRSDESYNISTGRKTSINELCQLIMKFMKINVNINYQENSDDTLVIDRVGSTKKAFNHLKFYYSVSLEEGLKKTIDWMLQ